MPPRTPRRHELSERDNWIPSQTEKQHRRDLRPVRNPRLTVLSFPRPSQRAALRATKAIAPSRAAFVAKPQVRHRSTHPRSAEPNLEVVFDPRSPRAGALPIRRRSLTSPPDRFSDSAPSAASTSRPAPASTSRTTSSTSSRSPPNTPTRASPTGKRLAASSPSTGTTSSTFAAPMSST